MENSQVEPVKSGLATDVQPGLPPHHVAAWARLDQAFAGSSFSLTKERLQCICEGGHRCECEDPDCQKTQSPFPGLHSNWITPEVLAMARPWQSNVVGCQIPESFKAAGIGMIVNLQEVGEHAHCGKGNLLHTGFSYDPESFMALGIGVYNFSWHDMGVPNLHKMLDIVQVMAHVTSAEKRKIAVHCHAGLGRTGLAIACCLVFLRTHNAQAAIALVRQGRPGSLQTHQQEHFVATFEAYLLHLRCVFQPVDNAKAASQMLQPVPLMAAPADVPGSEQGPTSSSHHLPGPLSDPQQTTPGSLSTVQPSSNSMSSSVLQLSAFSTAADARAISGARRRRGSAGAGQTAKHIFSRLTGSHTSKVSDGDMLQTTASSSYLPWSTDGAVRTGSMFGRPCMIAIQPPACLQEAMERQHRLLHGQERRQLWNLPKCVNAVAGALETAAHSHSRVQSSAADLETKSSSVLSEMAAYAALTCPDNATLAVAEDIAVQVNHGNWASVQSASPAVAMQLLQMWLQTFQEPILSLPLQQAVAAMLCPAPYSTTSDVLHSAVNSTAKSAVDFPLHDISIYMAVVQRLTAQQQFVVARLLTCVQVVRNGSRESSSLEALVSKLLQWLTRHLTGCCTTGSLSSSKEAAAVLHFLDCCLCDTVVMRLLTSSKASVTARAIQEQSSTSVSTQAASPAKQLAFPQLHQTARGSKEEDATAYSDSNDLEESKDDDSIQAYKLPITHHASEPPTSQTEMRKTQGPSLVDAGCPCFSSRLAKMVFAKAM